MMMKLNSFTTIGSLILLAPWDCEAQIRRSSPHYRVRPATEKRDLQTIQYNPLDMLLSFSDDGAQREDEFYLDIFDTPEILTNTDSPLIISNAMNFFLLEELDGVFDEIHTIEKVSSEIVNLKTRYGTYVNSSGIETDRIGTEARMKVIVSFDQTPSPAIGDVLFMLKYVMSDLSNFVTNLTGSVSSDNELSGVYEAIRREIRPPVLIQPPEQSPDQNIVVDISDGEQGQTGGGESDDSSPNLIAAATVPIVVGVATLAAILVFFAFRKKKPTETESSKASSVIMFDVENEIFSLDRSVESVDTKSPYSKPSPMPQDESSIQYSMSTGNEYLTDTPPACDSIFSGIDTEYGSVMSPKSHSSPKSMMTGFTCASGSTIQASNLNKSKNKKEGIKSPIGSNSLFSFLDPIEDADEEDVDDFELTERAQPTLKARVDHETSEDLFSTSFTEPSDGIQSSSSSSPLHGTSINIPMSLKIEDDAMEATKAQSDDPVSHVLADLENMETTISYVPRDASPVNQMNSKSPTPPSTIDEKKDDNGGKSAFRVATKASNLMSGLFKGRQKSGSTPNSPSSSPTHEVKLSAPSSPMQQVGRHWLTSADNTFSRRIPTTPKIDVNVDYDMMLSHPSPTDEEYNYSRDFSVNDNMQIVDRAPQSPDLDPTGGRRHAGDKIGGDGSALYQATAMKPTDWSCRSSDADSVGSSTVDDEGNQNPSNSAIPTNPAASENKKSVTASRQLMDDLVWLEKKIATVRGETKLTRSAPALEAISSDSSDENGMENHPSNDYTPTSDKDPSNIVCRDCFAPPGKLHIVIHSTKDGPAVHIVKDGSSLAGEIFPGDIIISVDNIDTRTCSAEEVMKMMASKGDQERKITVLRFLEET